MPKWAMMSDFSVTLPDRPGELARLAAKMGAAGINLVGLWGTGQGKSRARFYCVPERADAFRSFAAAEGLDVEEGRTFYLYGADRPGALAEWLDRIAAAGINLHAIQAVRVGGDFGGFVWADPADWETLSRLLTQSMA